MITVNMSRTIGQTSQPVRARRPSTMRLTTQEAESGGRMGPTMRRGPRYRPHLVGDSVEHRLAERDGRAPATWRWEFYAETGCINRTRMALEALASCGEIGRARMILGQFSAAVLPVELKLADLVHREGHADAAEDLTQADIVRTPEWIQHASSAELEGWERKLREQADASLQLADFIRREREQRKEQQR